MGGVDGRHEGAPRRGQVRMVGISNADVEQIDAARAILGDALVSVQNQFSPGLPVLGRGAGALRGHRAGLAALEPVRRHGRGGVTGVDGGGVRRGGRRAGRVGLPGDAGLAPGPGRRRHPHPRRQQPGPSRTAPPPPTWLTPEQLARLNTTGLTRPSPSVDHRQVAAVAGVPRHLPMINCGREGATRQARTASRAASPGRRCRGGVVGPSSRSANGRRELADPAADLDGVLLQQPLAHRRESTPSGTHTVVSSGTGGPRRRTAANARARPGRPAAQRRGGVPAGTRADPPPAPGRGRVQRDDHAGGRGVVVGAATGARGLARVAAEHAEEVEVPGLRLGDPPLPGAVGDV